MVHIASTLSVRKRSVSKNTEKPIRTEFELKEV